MAMENNDETQLPSRRAATKSSVLDDDARWRLAAEILQAIRDAGYDCELCVDGDVH